jgi:hypothetical protein
MKLFEIIFGKKRIKKKNYCKFFENHNLFQILYTSFYRLFVWFTKSINLILSFLEMEKEK